MSNERSRETITFYIEKELKQEFMIRLIREGASITDKLNEFIRNYVEG